MMTPERQYVRDTLFVPRGVGHSTLSLPKMREEDKEMTSEKDHEEQDENTQKKLFDGLKAAIVEHGGGDFLRLKDGESAAVTVDVDLANTDPTKQTPREEQDGALDKASTSYNDTFDAFRLAMRYYEFT